MRRTAVLVAFAVLTAACGGGGAAQTSPTVGAPTGATDPTGSVTGPTGSTGDTGAATGATGSATGAECTPEAPTQTGWQTLSSLTGDFTFGYPAEWENVSGDIGATAGELLGSEILAELGLTGDEPVPADVVRDPETGDNLGVFPFEGVTSTTEEIYAIQEDLYFTLPGTEFTGTELISCVDGSTAIGMEYSAVASGEGRRYQQLWYVVRDGTLYHLYVDAAAPAGAHVLTDVVRTWEWT